MGIKGDKNTEAANLSAMEMEEKLASIGNISTKKMFGGHGLFHEGKMFGMIDSKGRGYFKADDSLKTKFLAKGATKHSRMPYYSIPTSVVEDLDELLAWAQSAIQSSK
jgi:DNA transformation protein